jgi:outer membrane protein assembly factor BamE (lipoprotein component of BamABCDE complex)
VKLETDYNSQPVNAVLTYFTIGSTKDEVLQVQGSPTSVHKYESWGEEVWDYSYSTITFRRGRVKEYSNQAYNLKVKVAASVQRRNGSRFTIGSTKEEVLEAQGNPTSVHKYESWGEEVWDYSYSTVTFQNGWVKEYSNNAGNLRVSL